jgi:predicted O-methyltransferase YrrM
MTNTLTVPPVSILLDRLFAAEEPASSAFRQTMAKFSPDQRRAMMTSTTDYRAYYAMAKDVALAVSRETGKLLYLLARTLKAQAIVEFGTSFGISTLHLAAALRDNGGGKLIGSEFEPGKMARARAHLTEAGLADLAEIREGDALSTLAHDVPETLDLILLDGAKALYPRIFALLEPRLRIGGIVVADNAGFSPQYLALVRGEGFLSLSLPDDVELTMKLGA